MGEPTGTADEVTARYVETGAERLLVFERAAGGDDSGPPTAATVAQNRDGYAMLADRSGGPDGEEVERYYGLDVALDHAAELLGVPPGDLPVPPAARDMGM